MKTNKNIKTRMTKTVFLSVLLVGLSLSTYTSAKTEKSSSDEYTPMYSNPSYSNEALNTSSGAFGSQDQANQNALQAPPPSDPDPGNQVPAPSGVLPILAMALGLVFWRVHYQVRKSKK